MSNGDKEIDAGATDNENGSGAYLYSMYSPDKDMLVEMDLYGGRGRGFDETGGTGESFPQYNGSDGGEGGYSRIRFTMERNVEYVLAGMTDSVQTPYLYRKATLIANALVKVVMQDTRGRGGFGGGVNVAGEDGQGRFSGDGGARITAWNSTNKWNFWIKNLTHCDYLQIQKASGT